MTQSIFPGVEVHSLTIIKGVVQDDGTLGVAEGFGGGITDKDILGDNFITKTARRIFEEQVGERDALAYELIVKATNPASARVKAKAYVRLKNPFEPTLIAISNVEEIEGEGLIKTYSVSVPVIKSGLLGDI